MATTDTEDGTTVANVQPQFDRLDYKATHAAVLGRLFGHSPRPKIGRYDIVGQIGQGAMGRVYAARDAALGRDVAVKVIQVDGGPSPRARARLIREAQALARISHPNVVEVFEVGRYEANVFIAMEHVHGPNLRAWRDQGAPEWQACLEVLLQAGSGLAAAHEAGVLHRDFKPDNVVVGEDGRTRVLDFGVARAALEPSENSDPSLGLSMDDSGSITRTGAAVGSPAYMAPEQMLATDVDARSDQFGFCVTAFETLHGVRPFPGDNAAALLASMVDGRHTDVRDRTPRWLDAVIARGLAADPDERWPSMDALLAALRRGPRRVRAGWFGVGALAAVTLVAAGWTRATPPADRCDTTVDGLAQTWNAERRETLQSATDATLTAAVDERAEAWRTARHEACQLSASPQARDRALDCLARRRTQLRTSVEILLEERALTAAQRRDVVAGLQPAASCMAEDAPGIAPPDDPAVAREVEQIRDAIARSDALHHAGRWDDAIAIAQEQLPRAIATGWAPIEAELHLTIASNLATLDRGKAAAAAAQRGFFVAQQAGDDEMALRLATILVGIYGWSIRDATEGERWYEHGLALSARLGDPPRHLASLRTRMAQLRVADGDPKAAVELFRDAIALAESAGGVSPLSMAQRQNDLGIALLDLGELDDGRASMQEALATMQDILGPEHPRVAALHSTIGTSMAMAGDMEGARVEFERALEIQRSIGSSSNGLAMSYGNLGTLAQATGRYDEAKSLLEDALRLFRTVGGPSSPRVRATLRNLAANATTRKDHDAAHELLQRVLDIETLESGPEHRSVGDIHVLIADNALEQGFFAEAIDHYEQARDILEARLGPDHRDVSFALTGLGLTYVEAGDPQRALAPARRAVDIRRRTDGDPVGLAESESALGRALRAAGHDDEGVEYLVRARDRYQEHDEPDLATSVDALLATE